MIPASYAIGVTAVVGLALGWIGIQAAWARAFPEDDSDPDVLARRMGCGGCGCTHVCKKKLRGLSAEEEIE